MPVDDNRNEFHAKEFSLDSQGKLNENITHDFGADHAGRGIRLTAELLPMESEFRGSRRHILDLLDCSDWVKQLNELIAVEGINVSTDPCPTPKGHNAIGETDLDSYILNHCKGFWPEAEKQLDRGSWWAPHGGTRPQMDLKCRLKVNRKDGYSLSKRKPTKENWIGVENCCKTIAAKVRDLITRTFPIR